VRSRICYYTTKRNAHYAINYVSYTTRFGFESGSPSCPTHVQTTTASGNASRSAHGCETEQASTLHCQVVGHLQKHLPWVLNELFDLDQECHGFPTVK
jgi:hypothetical protein